MVVGILLLSVIVALFATMGTIIFGVPILQSVLIYTAVGAITFIVVAIGSVAIIGLATLRRRNDLPEEPEITAMSAEAIRSRSRG